MLRVSSSWVNLRMSLGRLYRRLLVAAGAVAFFVAKWFCRPMRRRTCPFQQNLAFQREPEEEPLLQEGEPSDEHLSVCQESLPGDSSDEAPELVQPDEVEQLRNDAPLAPEDIALEPTQVPAQDLTVEEGNPPETASDANVCSGSSSPVATVLPGAPARGAEEKSALNVVDEAYLISLIDQELGPPKFAIPKQAPAEQSPAPAPEPSVPPSLEELLERSFGPPKFAIPKPALALQQQPTIEAVNNPEPNPVELENSTAAETELLAPQPSPPHGHTEAEQQQRGASLKRSLPGREAGGVSVGGFVLLTLSVTHGPAAGKLFTADDPSIEYKIGRLPDCALQILDQEISGRHASLRWDGSDSRWKLHDVGSLNGTTVAGEAIGRDYKVPGDERPLVHGDEVCLGSLTRLRVVLAAASDSDSGTATKRHHWAIGLDDVHQHPERHPDTVFGALGMQGLPTPSALLDYPGLGVRLCVHNRLGADHKRMGQGCEDVPYWEMPYGPYERAGIVCIFDGHHGVKAAHQAREHLPAVLRSKLLQRDGRAAPPLPSPPPPPLKRLDEDEKMVEGGDGVSSASEGGAANARQPGAAASATAGPSADHDADSANNSAAGPTDAGNGPGGGSSDACTSATAAASAHGEAGEQGGGGAESEPALLLPPPDGPPLPPLLRNRDPASQQALLKETFLATDQYMSLEEGCTATVVLLEADREGGGWWLQSGNVGDSSAVLINFTRGTWCRLSEDHRIASSESERQRLAARGHAVRTRLYGLNISRMLGDRFLKEEDLGFLAEPFVGPTVQVEPTDWAVLVVASDGLWDVLSEERAAKMLLQEAAKSHPPCASSGSPQLGSQAVADLLLTQALVLRSKDDITISVLEMGPHLWR